MKRTFLIIGLILQLTLSGFTQQRDPQRQSQKLLQELIGRNLIVKESKEDR